MQEKTLPRALSGTEIKTAVIKKITDMMERDCRLASHVAYGAFSFHFRLDIKFQDLGSNIKSTAHEASEEIAPVEDPEIPLQVETLEVSDEEKPPNQVRVETGQGVPVAVKLPSGKMEEKRVTYKDPKFREKKVKGE